MNIYFDHYRHDTEDIITLFFNGSPLPFYTAGQFIELNLPHQNPDQRGIRRYFTLSSSPDEKQLAFTTKLSKDHQSTYKQALVQLQNGQQFSISQPMGDFVLPKSLLTPLIFVAGGIGITPFISMTKWMTNNNEQRSIRMIHAISTEDDIIFQDVFDKASQHITIIVSNPSASWGGERGRISPELIIGLEKPTVDSLFFLSGPEPMIEVLSDGLHKAGIQKKQIVNDFFPGYQNI